MNNQPPQGLIGRLTNLIRGIFSSWIKDRESRSPRAVYQQAIDERIRQYRQLKEAVAGILYMRNKLEGEIHERRAEIARLNDDIRRAVRRGDDQASVALIVHKQAQTEELERAEQERRDVRAEAEEAKRNLVSFREEIRALEREKGRVLARLANAHARRRIQEALEGLSVDADMRALESVREHVARMSTEGELSREVGSDGLRTRLREIRQEARLEGARRELEELKRELDPRSLPPALNERANGAQGAKAVPVS